jgi:anaerobic magnesium-protoporphyrin IX monomethyl ester cyclase
MRIVLVHPAGSNWIMGKKDLAAVANRMAPIGLLSIASYLERSGHEVFVHDCLGPGAVPGVEANAAAIVSLRPDMIGISATTSGFLDGYRLAALVKEKRSGVTVVFGGVHISALGGPLLEQYGAIDYLCLGEGEATLAELADGGDPKEIDGLAWRDGGSARVNRPRVMIQDLDSLPFPAYGKLAGFPRGYNLPLFSYVRAPGATMITSRGCPYQCSYCDRSVFKRGFRYNSAGYIYEHMKHLRTDFGVRHVNIYDDLFTMNRERIEELCGLLLSKPLGMNFNCAVRVGHADNGLLGLLKKAGCLMVSLGIESADPEMLKRHKAGVKLEAVRDTVARIQRQGLRAKGLFMMGLPGETEDSIRATSDFVMSLGLDDMNMAKFTPFPGAPIWAGIENEGTLDNDWQQMNCLNFVFVPRGIASRERLDRLYNEHVKRFYSDRKWRRKFTRRLWQHRWSLWYLIKHIPSFAAARRNFEPGE